MGECTGHDHAQVPAKAAVKPRADSAGKSGLKGARKSACEGVGRSARQNASVSAREDACARTTPKCPEKCPRIPW